MEQLLQYEKCTSTVLVVVGLKADDTWMVDANKTACSMQERRGKASAACERTAYEYGASCAALSSHGTTSLRLLPQSSLRRQYLHAYSG